MKIQLISDVVLDPVVKELRKLLPGFEINARYEDDLVLYLIAFDYGMVDKGQLFLIHSDQLFLKKGFEWQSALFNAIDLFTSKLSNRVLFSNSLEVPFVSAPSQSSKGFLSDNADNYTESWKKFKGKSNLSVFDFMDLCWKNGIGNIYNYNLGHLYQMPYTKLLIKEFGMALAAQVQWMMEEEKKVIVLDCDNTLWSGVVGEDGIDGIKCDKNSDGILHYHFQQFLLAKKNEGFLLALCTKNNEAEVINVFENKSMPLSFDDFIVKKINWEDKCSNIKEIAALLNLGTDSFIFIDDNPFEVNSVKELIHGISCFEFKNDYQSFIELAKSNVFKRKNILQDDVDKHAKYKVQFERNNEERQFLDFDEFLKSLDIKIDVRLNDVDDFERLSQLTGKTNQFNFNKNEYSKVGLEDIMNNGGKIYSLKVVDKFGDYGTVGLMILEPMDGKMICENFLISCRALGKRIEFEFYNEVVSQLQKEDISIEYFRFTKSEKNIPAQEFYKTLSYDNKH